MVQLVTGRMPSTVRDKIRQRLRDSPDSVLPVMMFDLSLGMTFTPSRQHSCDEQEGHSSEDEYQEDDYQEDGTQQQQQQHQQPPETAAADGLGSPQPPQRRPRLR
jgi:hypothetical protein